MKLYRRTEEKINFSFMTATKLVNKNPKFLCHSFRVLELDHHNTVTQNTYADMISLYSNEFFSLKNINQMRNFQSLQQYRTQ